MSEARARRLGERIHEIVAEALKFKIKDPRVGFVTVTDVRVTADLRDATVFYTVLGDAEEQEATAAALSSATGLLRSEVGKGTGVKFTPTLTFVPDAVPENARHIEDLLRETAERDSAIAAAAAGARFAGDADPYRTPDDDGDDDVVAEEEVAAEVGDPDVR
ncbi:MAG: 30S ribosome-binding factor RbfA [Actinobacteria bacterium]|nr:MAG: 30S ribosome-binding factor RbfA [Actinomycetota bacterium]